MARTDAFRRLQWLAARWLSNSSPAGREGAERLDRLSRRHVLAAGAAIGVAGCSGETEPRPISPGPRTHRIAVIGAGLAGLHCAFRLDQALSLLPRGTAELTVYEANARVGGRVYTARNQFAEEKLVCELGAEFIDKRHRVMFALASEFGVHLSDRSAESHALLSDVFWLNDKAVGRAQLDDQFSKAAPAIQRVISALKESDTLLRELDNTTLAEWLRIYVPPRNYAELNELMNCAYRVEFGLEPDEQSALNLLHLLPFKDEAHFGPYGQSDRSSYSAAGNDSLATQLAMALRDKVKLNSRLVSVRRGDVEDDAVYTLTFETNGVSAFEVYAERVIFALPFSVLRGSRLDRSGLSAEKLRLINELGYGSNSKLVVEFGGRVWRNPNDAAPQGVASVLSNLDFQQISESADATSSHGLLINLVGGKRARRMRDEPVAESLQKLLLELEPILPGVTADHERKNSVGPANAAIRMDWSASSFARGSRACLLPGQWNMREAAGKREGNLHFCGEHCSLSFPGSMEGAAVTGALVAAEILDDLDLPYPEKLAELLEQGTLMPQANYGSAS